MQSVERCVVVEGMGRCVRCTEKKKGCWRSLQSYVEWYYAQTQPASVGTSVFCMSMRTQLTERACEVAGDPPAAAPHPSSASDTDMPSGSKEGAPLTHYIPAEQPSSTASAQTSTLR